MQEFFQSTGVTSFQNDPTNPNGRIITYNCTINGAAGTARLRVVDNGEPGRDDIFDLTLSTGYHAAGSPRRRSAGRRQYPTAQVPVRLAVSFHRTADS